MTSTKQISWTLFEARFVIILKGILVFYLFVHIDQAGKHNDVFMFTVLYI